MFEKFDEAAADAIAASKHECLRLRSAVVTVEHLLLGLTRDPDNAAARALATMNIRAENIKEEIDRQVSRAGVQPDSAAALVAFDEICFSESVRCVFERASQIRLFFGSKLIAPEHILLGIVELQEDNALRILEELGANLTFLKRQVLKIAAKEACLCEEAPNIRHTIITGVNALISTHQDSVDQIRELSQRTSTRLTGLPESTEIILMVFLAYLPDFLETQVAFQRYLLEETLRLLNRRTGPVDKELTASIVSSAAQHLRAEVRATIEYLWTHECRMLNQIPDEAEHDLIGSVIEDLWWTHSEEIALHDVFDEALDDYRRKHVLNLQKRKLELAQRLNKLKGRLIDTIKQCFVKRTMSA